MHKERGKSYAATPRPRGFSRELRVLVKVSAIDFRRSSQ